MKILSKEELLVPQDLLVEADYVRYDGKLYKKGNTIKDVTGNDKAILIASKKCSLKEAKESKKEKGSDKE